MEMNQPKQSKSVQRVILTYLVDQNEPAAAALMGTTSSNGVGPTEFGIEPSWSWGDVLDIAKKTVPVILNAL
jgi:hypothetical protein